MNFLSLLPHILLFFLTTVFCKIYLGCDTENQKVLTEFDKCIGPLVEKYDELGACNEATLLSDSEYKKCIFALKFPEIVNSSIFKIMSAYPYAENKTNDLYCMNFINFAIQDVCSQLKENPELTSSSVGSDSNSDYGAATTVQSTANNGESSLTQNSNSRAIFNQSTNPNFMVQLLCLFIILFLAAVAYNFYILKYE